MVGNIDYLLHFGSETNIAKSISNPLPFINSNVTGTFNLLEFVRKQSSLQYFIYPSTNEVFGYGKPGEKFTEWSKYNCLNPYSATKAASEDLCLAYSSTYQVPVMIIRTMNIFGERQDPRKFIPRIVYSILHDMELPIYTNELGEVGSRAYLHVHSFVSAFMYLLEIAKTKPDIDNINWRRDKINIAGDEQISNLTLAKKIEKIMKKTLHYKLYDFYSNQTGHELHSALDCSRLSQLGWFPNLTFETQLENTVKWLVDNPKWLM